MKKRKKGRKGKSGLFLVLIIALLVVATVFFIRGAGNKPKKIVTLEGLNAVYEEQLLDASDFDRIDGQVYLSYDFIKANLDPEIAYDKGESTVIITHGDEVKRLPLNSPTGWVNEKEFSIRDPLIEKNGKILLPIETFIYLYDVNLRYIDDQELIVIDRTDTNYLQGTVLVDQLGIASSLDKDAVIYAEVPKGERVYVYEEYDRCYKVRSAEGIPGYVPKDAIKLDLKSRQYKEALPKRDEGQLPPSPLINLTWDYTYGKLEDGSTATYMQGINVVSPMWFSIGDEAGNLIDRGHEDYAAAYHAQGVSIWGALDNQFNADLTKAFLGSSRARSNAIAQLMYLVDVYGLDGINIDFEQFYPEEREAMVQFTRELSINLRARGKVSSIDVNAASDRDEWAREFDRKSLSEAVDYVCLMAYDQHWAGSPTAGSVAQYRWVENSINGQFRSMPPEKIILGMPLYTRLWIEENGSVTSRAIGMETAEEIVSSRGLTPQWDEESRQYVVTYEEDGKLYRMWLETEESLTQRISLVHKYGLAGAATWRKGFEKPEIWASIDKSLF